MTSDSVPNAPPLHKLHHICIVCGERADNRVCRACCVRLSVPCPECGKPTPTITRKGRPVKHMTCTACTSRRLRRPVTCRVCQRRSHDIDKLAPCCPDCMAIEAECPVCKGPMPKFTKRGVLRKFCSNRCIKIAHPTTSQQARKTATKRYANHAHKSHENDRARATGEYRQWRKAVFERDDYTCQDCGRRGGELHPHHLKPFALYPELRYEIDNGMTLCDKCHRKRHKHVFIGRTRKSRQPNRLRQ